MSEFRRVVTEQAPQAIGPYSQAIIVGDLVFTAGQIPLDPSSGEIVRGDIATQAARVLENIRAVLEAAGAGLDTVIKTTVYLDDMDDFPAMNDVYARYFGDHRPARSAVQVSRLPKDVKLEIEAIAAL